MDMHLMEEVAKGVINRGTKVPICSWPHFSTWEKYSFLHNEWADLLGHTLLFTYYS